MTDYLGANNEQFIDKARAVLGQRPNVRWLIGSSCSGKSTIARVLTQPADVALYDMDEAVFGRYRFDADRHPATTAWFTAPDPMAFMLGLSWEAFDSLYRAANAEYLDLLADDLSAGDDDRLTVIDGGITHPSVLAQVLPAAQIACLSAPDALRAAIWNTAPERASMKAMVLALPNGPSMWHQFLRFDDNMAATLERESREQGIRIFAREKYETIDSLAGAVSAHFGLE